MNLQIELAPQHKSGLLLRNPVLLASGTSGYGIDVARSAGLGGFVCNSVSLYPQEGAVQPHILETPSGLLSAFARPDPGIQKVLRTYGHVWSNSQTPVIVSLAGSSVGEFAELAAQLDEVPGVAALELNLASPNLATDGAIFGADPAAVERLVEAVRLQSALPLIAKLAPYDGDLFPVALAAASAGIDAISLIHTLPGLSVDTSTRRVALYGGLSGPAVKPLALRALYEIARALRPTYPRVPLIGIGGISCANDALEFLMAGASAVQVGSINFVNPFAGVEIVAGIEAFMQREGIADLAEIIGVALPD